MVRARALLDRHRTNGIIGMFLAGGVCITAFSMMHRDIVNTERAAAMRDVFGPFEPWFFYGVAWVEIPMILAFGYAVIQSILKRHRVHDHAWWLISTVFIIMMPALGRGIQNVYIGMHIGDWPAIDIMPPIYFTQVLIIGLTLLTAWKFKALKHPGTYLAIAINLYACFVEPLGRSEALQTFLQTVIKG